MTLVNKAVAAALFTAAAGSASAIDIANWATDAHVVNVYISGSTAVGTTLINASIHAAVAGTQQICGGNIDVYDDKADKANPGKQLLIYCTAAAGLGLPAGATIAIFKEFELGSANGVLPLIAQAGGAANPLQFYNAGAGGLTDANCAAAVAGTLKNSLAYTFHGSCAHITNVPAIEITGGVADLEGTFFGATQAQIAANLTGVNGLDPVWAIPVNSTMYNLLQKAQGLTPGVPTAANQPTLSKSQVAAMFDQSLTDIGQISGTEALGTHPQIAICRREAGSGTEVSAEIFWLNSDCTDLEDEAMPIADDTNVFEMNSTGNLAGCLSATDQAGQNVTTDDGLNPPGGGPRPAIGTISSENGPGTFDGVHVFAVKLDGATPTLENVVNGFYPFFEEDWFYNQISKCAPPVNGNYCKTTPPGIVWESLKVNIGHPGFLADSNANYVNYWGQSGDLALSKVYSVLPAAPNNTPAKATPTIPATNATVVATPVNAYTHNNSGTVNNCNPPILNGIDFTAPYSAKD